MIVGDVSLVFELPILKKFFLITLQLYIQRRIRFRIIFAFGWFNVLVFTLISTAAVLLYLNVGCAWIAIPFLPVSLIGTATAFYIGFKNNSSYDRLWEARRLWGAIVNDSRSWALSVRDYLGNQFRPEALPDSEIEAWKKKLIYRHLAYVNALRIQLRRPQTWEHNRPFNQIFREKLAGSFGSVDMKSSIAPFLTESELAKALKSQNVALHLMSEQSRDLEKLRVLNVIEDFRHVDLQKLIQNLINSQGGAERIKNFPFPRQYAFFSAIFVWVFVILLPFSLLGSFSEVSEGFVWMVIPFSVLTSWILMTMELVGDYSENPFENLINDVPLSAMCRNIEIDLRELLGETELPERITHVNGILM
jgi:putative membrane protein